MIKKRIILVFPDPPLPFGSAAARAYYVTLKGLVSRGHAVTAFVASGTADTAGELAAYFPSVEYDVRCFPYSAHRSLRTRWNAFREPYSYPFSPELRADLAKTLAEGYDVLHLETQWAGWVGRAHSAKAIVNIHSLYSIDLPSAEGGFADRLRKHRVISSERSLLRSFPHLCTLTDPLASHLREMHPQAAVHVAPLGFDSSLYPFQVETSTRVAAPTVGLIGSFNWHPTYTAGVRLLTKLWPLIQKRVPESRLLLVGRNAKAALSPHLPADTRNITIEENVPDTIKFFRMLDVLLYAPEVGTGMKVKVLEAFALGVPVTTNRDGVEGLPVQDRVHAGLAETDEALVERAVGLLSDPDARQRQAIAARRLVEQVCAPERLIHHFENAYEQIA